MTGDDMVAWLRSATWAPDPYRQWLGDAALEIERLRISNTLIRHAVAYYLTDTIPDPTERQRIASSRFGKAVAKLTAEEATR